MGVVGVRVMIRVWVMTVACVVRVPTENVKQKPRVARAMVSGSLAPSASMWRRI